MKRINSFIVLDGHYNPFLETFFLDITLSRKCKSTQKVVGEVMSLGKDVQVFVFVFFFFLSCFFGLFSILLLE